MVIHKNGDLTTLDITLEGERLSRKYSNLLVTFNLTGYAFY